MATICKLNQVLIEMQGHAIYGRAIKKLNKDEKYILVNIANELNNDDLNTAQHKINRLWLCSENKPKRWVIICDLLGNAVSIKDRQINA